MYTKSLCKLDGNVDTCKKCTLIVENIDEEVEEWLRGLSGAEERGDLGHSF